MQKFNRFSVILIKFRKQKLLKKPFQQFIEVSWGWIKLHFYSAYNLCITTTELLKQNIDLFQKKQKDKKINCNLIQNDKTA